MTLFHKDNVLPIKEHELEMAIADMILSLPTRRERKSVARSKYALISSGFLALKNSGLAVIRVPYLCYFIILMGVTAFWLLPPTNVSNLPLV
jgi:hypothetical protein